MKQGLPQSARNALARQATADEHPSADLLTGFAEHSLSTAERDRMTSHLAVCADCREIVFLASAAAEAEQHIAVSPAALPKRRLSWASWKWLAPAVAMLLVVSGVIIERQRTPEARPAATQMAGVPQPTASQVAQAPAPSEDKAPASENNRLTLRNKPPALPTEKKRAASGQLPDANGYQYGLLSQSQPNGGNDLTYIPEQAAAPPSQARQQSSLNMATGAAAAGGTFSNAASGERKLESAVSAPAAKSATDQVSSGTQAAPLVQAETSSLVAKAQAKAKLQGSQPVAMPAQRWRITDDGHLERSMKAGEWTRVLSDEAASFRVVAVIGAQVWAGGSRGALFHSSDGGAGWTEVSLTQNGQTESSTLDSIRFDTELQGTVTTDSGATWKTIDGGKTWSRQ